MATPKGAKKALARPIRIRNQNTVSRNLIIGHDQNGVAVLRVDDNESTVGCESGNGLIIAFERELKLFADVSCVLTAADAADDGDAEGLCGGNEGFWIGYGVYEGCVRPWYIGVVIANVELGNH